MEHAKNKQAETKTNKQTKNNNMKIVIKITWKVMLQLISNQDPKEINKQCNGNLDVWRHCQGHNTEQLGSWCKRWWQRSYHLTVMVKMVMTMVLPPDSDDNGPTTWRWWSRWWWLWSYHVTVMVKMVMTMVLPPDGDGQDGDDNGPTMWQWWSRRWWQWSYHVTVMVKMVMTMVPPCEGDGQDGDNNGPTITMWRWWSRWWSELWSRQWSDHDDSDHTYAKRIMLLLTPQIMMTMLFGWCRQWWKPRCWNHDQSAIWCKVAMITLLSHTSAGWLDFFYLIPRWELMWLGMSAGHLAAVHAARMRTVRQITLGKVP